VIDSGKEGRPETEDGCEASKEDGFVAMSRKKLVGIIQMVWFHKKEASEAEL